jgi:valyl-tRNA synthetase
MEKDGLTVRKEDYILNVPRSQRGGEIIEPMISRQWFVDAEPQAKLALAAVKSGRIKIVPERFTKVWENWLTNIQPWCISRQLWWGHRIPVWYCQDCKNVMVETIDPVRCSLCGGTQLEQDPDVLDTWFSSALWPFSTLGWPEQTPDLQRFYPTDIMETGYDILFFWVARMVMAGTMFTNDIPFHTVYLHGLVRDEIGRKMSKTTGNVVDPLELCQEYGTDALRFTLLTGSTPGNDLNLAVAKVANNRNFANKIWNVTRFIIHTLNQLNHEDDNRRLEQASYTLADKWILYRLQLLTADVNRLFENYQYGEAGRQIHDFFWNDFADWYLELAKVQVRESTPSGIKTLNVLLQVLDSCLRFLHPFMPYVTEETWQHVKEAFQDSKIGIEPTGGWPDALIIADWPSAVSSDADLDGAREFERIRELVRAIRGVRAEYGVQPAKRLPALIITAEKFAMVESQRPLISFLARLDENKLKIISDGEVPEDSVTVAVGKITAYLPLSDMVDFQQERERLAKEIQELDNQIQRVTNLLESDFSSKAPEQVVEREREKLTRYKASHSELTDRLAGLKHGS